MPRRGWVSLHRKIQDHWLWSDKPFSRGQAWIDIVLNATHKEKDFMFGGSKIELEEGEFVTSDLKFMNAWGWSKTKVRTFLKLLEQEKMIERKPDNKKTIIKVINYNVYQDEDEKKKLQENSKEISKGLQKDTINNSNNNNNINKEDLLSGKSEKSLASQEPEKEKTKFADFVLMTNDEHQSLISRVGEQGALRCIEILDNYKGSTGKKYKSDYRAILSWVTDRYQEEQPKGGNIRYAQLN